MKVKFSLIPFIPVAIAMIGLKIMSLFGLDSDGMFLGMNKMNITYAVIGLAIALFVVCVLINILDRKTAPVYAVKKNPIAGILSIFAGIAVVCNSLFNLIGTLPDSEYYLMTVICALLSVPAGIALILISKVHFVGNASASGISVLFVFPSLWGCAELVSEFLNATKVSISSSDMTALFCYIFLTLYFFSHSMIVSRVKGRNPVKACFIYGLPAAAITLTYGVYEIFTSFVENSGLAQVIFGAELVILALYTISFVVEMAFNTLTKDEVEIIDGMPDAEDTYENSYVKSGGYDELVFSETASITDPKSVQEDENNSYVSHMESLNDFVIGYEKDGEDEPIPYLTKTEMENAEKSGNAFVTTSEAEPTILQGSNESEISDAKVTDKSVPEQKKPEDKLLRKAAEPKEQQVASATKANKANDDELEQILSEVKSQRRAAAEQKTVVNAQPKAVQKKAEPELSEIDKLLQELENKK